MQWIEAAPTAAALTALLYLPGYLGLRLLGLRGLLALAGAPAATTAVLGAGAVAFGAVGVPWEPLTVTALLALTVGLCAGLGRMLRARPLALAPVGPGWAFALAAATAFAAAVQLYAFVLGMGRPDAVQQIYDPIFHLNAADTILRTGNASSLGGLDPMYGDRTGVFYPAVWPSIVALGATASEVVVASNMLLLLTGVVVWLVGIVVLARAVLPRHPLVAVAAPVVASSYLAFPANLHVMQGIFGYSLAIALWPGMLAVLVMGLRHRSVPGLLAGAVGAAGLLVVHPSAVMLLAVGVLPLAGHHLTGWGRELASQGRRLLGVAMVAAVPAVVVVVVAAIYLLPQLQSMANFPHPIRELGPALRTAFLSATTVGWTSPWANAVVAVLVLIGAVVAWGMPSARWVTVGWASTVVLFLLTALGGPLRDLGAFWYANPDRPEAMLPLFGALLGGLGVLAVARLAARLAARRAGWGAGVRSTAAGAVAAAAVLALAFVTSGAFRTDERIHGWTWWAFNPDHPVSIDQPAYASWEELELLRDLPVPDDAVVLGDPASGAVFTQSVGDAIAFIPHVNPSSWGATQQFLMAHFADIHTDPAVCDVVRAEDIEYFYADDPVDPSWATRAPGLYDVDTSTGFTLVDTGGTARLYRIDACD